MLTVGESLGILNGDVEIVAGVETKPLGLGVVEAAEPQVPATVVKAVTPEDPLASIRTQLWLLSAM